MDIKKLTCLAVLVMGLSLVVDSGSTTHASEYLHITESGFTRLPVGARALSMGGAFTAVASDYSATRYNPAGLVNLDSRAFASMYTDLYGLGLLTHNYFSFVEPNAGLGSGGISWSHLSASLESEKWYQDLVSYSYAKELSSRKGRGTTSWGVNLKYLRESTPWEDAIGYSIDLAYLRKKETLSWGISCQNVTSKIDWDTGRREVIPLNVVLGMATNVTPHFLFALDCEGSTDDIPHTVRAGAELELGENFFLRAGAIKRLQEDNDLDLTAGLGFQMGLGEGNALSFDYAFLSPEILSDTHYFSLSFTF